MKLMLSQKNNLFDIIEDHGLSPNSFQITEPSEFNNNRTVITYKNSDFYFRFFQHPDKHVIILDYSPSEHLYERQEWVGIEWYNLQGFFVRWITCLIREISEDDKWGRLEQEISQVNISFENENGKFTAAEYEDLKTKLNLFRKEIRNIQLSELQLKTIENKIDHLTEMATTLTKFDWKGLFIGTIISIIIQLTVTHDNAKLIWEVIKKVFNKYFLP